MLPSDSAVFGLTRHERIILSSPVRFSVTICESPDKSISLSLLVSIKDGGDKSSCTLVESASHLISGMVHLVFLYALFVLLPVKDRSKTL